MCCSSWGRKESNVIERLNNNNNNITATQAQGNPSQGWVPLIGVLCPIQAQAKPFSGRLQPCCLGACQPPAARESRCPARPQDCQVLACSGFLSSLCPAALPLSPFSPRPSARHTLHVPTSPCVAAAARPTPVPSCKPLLLLPRVLAEPGLFTRQVGPRSGQLPPSPSALRPAWPHSSP